METKVSGIKLYDGSNDPDVIEYLLNQFCVELKSAINEIVILYDQKLIDKFNTIIVRIK